MKHTPGPWRTDGFQIRDCSGPSFGSSRLIADLNVRVGEEDEESDANADLISAAPDLLEAACEALQVIRNRPETWEQGTELMHRIFSTLSAAITKAGGRPA